MPRRGYRGWLLVILLLLLGVWFLELRPISLKVTDKPKLAVDGTLVYEFQQPLELKKGRAYLIKFVSPCGRTIFLPRNHEARTVEGAEGRFERGFTGGIVCMDTPRLVEVPQ